MALPLLSSSTRSCEAGEEITGSPFTAHAKTRRALHKKARSSRYLYTYRVIEPHELLHGYLDYCVVRMPDKSQATLGQTTQAKLYLYPNTREIFELEASLKRADRGYAKPAVYSRYSEEKSYCGFISHQLTLAIRLKFTPQKCHLAVCCSYTANQRRNTILGRNK